MSRRSPACLSGYLLPGMLPRYLVISCPTELFVFHTMYEICNILLRFLYSSTCTRSPALQFIKTEVTRFLYSLGFREKVIDLLFHMTLIFVMVNEVRRNLVLDSFIELSSLFKDGTTYLILST